LYNGNPQVFKSRLIAVACKYTLRQMGFNTHMLASSTGYFSRRSQGRHPQLQRLLPEEFCCSKCKNGQFCPFCLCYAFHDFCGALFLLFASLVAPLSLPII
jgi:hypothetical protein